MALDGLQAYLYEQLTPTGPRTMAARRGFDDDMIITARSRAQAELILELRSSFWRPAV
ncbi:MAG: hypothetical protein ACLUES_13325 [Flavonifractor plautii]